MVTKSKEAQAKETEKNRLAREEEKQRIDKKRNKWKRSQQGRRDRKKQAKQQQQQPAAMESTVPSTPTGGSNASAMDGASASMKYLNEYDAENVDLDRKDDKMFMNDMISSTLQAVSAALKEKREQDHQQRMQRTTSQRTVSKMNPMLVRNSSKPRRNKSRLTPPSRTPPSRNGTQPSKDPSSLLLLVFR
jgi:hypothetical protein